MAKKFDNAGSNKTIKAVAKANNEKANVIQVKMISDENLVDCPENEEDVNDIEDLLLSMKELGFTDPLEVTDFEMEEGKYMIISGHRRRMAGRKMGFGVFPCIVKKFNDKVKLNNYLLMANSQRDSAKDPLLFSKRYKMHETYLKEKGFKGGYREEIAKRLGISVQQADRYNSFNKIILPFWDMVRGGLVGMSSLLPLASHNPEEQEDILTIINVALDEKVNLTRDLCNRIVRGYRDGKRTWNEIMEMKGGDKDFGVGVSIMAVNPEPTETSYSDEKPNSRNNEVNHDFSHREGLEGGGTGLLEEERPKDVDYGAIEKIKNNEKKLRERDGGKDEEKVENIKKLLEKLEISLNDVYSIKVSDESVNMMESLGGMIDTLGSEIIRLGDCLEKLDGVNKAKKIIQREYDFLKGLID